MKRAKRASSSSCPCASDRAVRLTSLSLRDFRNAEAIDLEPAPGFNVIVGDNGQGKTNLVEAVHLLATLKSFRGAKNAHLIREGAEEAHCRAWIERGPHRRQAELRIRPRSKRVALNGEVIRKLAGFFGTLNAVTFVPEDVQVMKASPSERRLLLDRIIFHAEPSFADESARFEKTLKQRNALLKSDVPDEALLRIYDEQLASSGVDVWLRRRAMLSALEGPLRENFRTIFAPEFDARWELEPQGFEDLPWHDREGLEAALLQGFRSARRADFARGFTTVGPHRDDVAATLDGRPVKAFASQGQRRALVLAIKITEIQLLRERWDDPPILLLDDVSSELDPERNRQLFAFLATFDGQVFITTTDDAVLRLGVPYQRWRVEAGRVRLDPAAAPPPPSSDASP